MINYDVAVIGGGPAGMSAALSAWNSGAKKIVIIERDDKLGGILQQCIHSGFGLHRFKEELTGPEYGQRYEEFISETGIEVELETLVTDVSSDKIITAMNQKDGLFQIKTKSIILAMGCRERPRGALNIPGTRPSGVYSAGTAQKMVNILGYMPGKEVVILGSGDIGLIMARRLTLEGAKVKAVCEIMEDSGGLTRNIVQCLRDFHIPLLLNHTVVKIHGNQRVSGVTIAKVDENLKVIDGTQQYIECDTLMLSVGLIPENELSQKAGVKLDQKTKGPVVDSFKETSIEGIFACGNVVKVHELVDYVSQEGDIAGEAAAKYALGSPRDQGSPMKTMNHQEQKKGVRYLGNDNDEVVICTNCPNGCQIKTIRIDGEIVTFQGNICKIGEEYARRELTNPARTLTTTIRGTGGVFVPVKSSAPLDKRQLFNAMNVINKTTCNLPIKVGDIIIKDIIKSGIDIIATRTME